VYVCRHCHKLAYRTQREQAHDPVQAVGRTPSANGLAGWQALRTVKAATPKGCATPVWKRWSNKLNEPSHALDGWLDIGAAQAAGRVNQAVEAVGEIHRA